MTGILLLAIGILLIGLVLCNYYLFNYLIVLENYNVIILLVVLSDVSVGCRVMFITIMSLFVVEASLMLVIIGSEIKGGCLRVPLGL
uniref:NADH dehydrogenase subunit 4L n=1 Tax=Schistosoma margrebowiei TaxID=48269 RepID=A0A1E1GJA0_9TREM|nr:NADH dehydrogenase subunit 4L [Schistosoma margrebowiei]